MPSKGETGHWLGPEKEAKLNAIKVTGTCDSGCGGPATHWFGMSSVATCGSSKCVQKQQDRWDTMVANQQQQDEERY